MSNRQKRHFKDVENYDFRVRLVSSTFIKAQKIIWVLVKMHLNCYSIKKLRQGTCSRYVDKLHKSVDKVHVVNMLITYISKL